MRPGDDPFGHLAEVLVKPDALEVGQTENTEQTEKDKTTRRKAPMIEATLRRSSLGIVEATRQAGLSQQGNLLIVVDQFEELFRFKKATKETKGRDEAAGFVKLLLEAAKQEEESIYVVLTMRSDFLGDCAQFRDLPEALNDGQYLIPRMTQDQRREAITGPVAVGGGTITPRLVQRLLNDVGDDPDQLPILQHALMRTWKEWEKDKKNGNPIDIQEYEAVGGLSDALSNHAQDAYDTLPDQRSKAIAEKLFKCLTEKGPDNREIRRPTTVKQIAAVANAEPNEVIDIINHFRSEGRSFLMTPDSKDLHEDALVDISHESLIRQWKTLRKWVEEEADSRATYLRIVDGALRHQEKKGGLWRFAIARAYNDWVFELFAPEPQRFRPAAMIPLDDVAAAFDESKRCIEKGFKTLFLPVVVPWKPYWHPDYEPLWALAAEARVPLSFHVFSGNIWFGTEFAFLPFLPPERYEAAQKMHRELGDVPERYSSTVVGMAAGMSPIVDLTGAGVLERHPDLRFAIVESECGWLAWALSAMDSMQERRRLFLSKLPLRASEYFLRQGAVAITDDPVGVHNLPITGSDCILWGNDYPHDEGTFPNSRRVIDGARTQFNSDYGYGPSSQARQ